MASSDVEPFPPLQTEQSTKQSRTGKSGSVRRRKSTGLGAELPGDTSVPAFATLGSPPATPTEPTVCAAAAAGELRC
jgi:acyl-CoA-dependent ceramide synthase